MIEWMTSVVESGSIYGESVEIFSKFSSIDELIKSKVHSTKYNIKGKKDGPAESILLNSSVHQDFGKIVIFDATTETKEGIASLIKNNNLKYPIRVIRGKDLQSEYTPSVFDCFRYDGLYWISSYWKEKKGDDVFMKIRLVRFLSQPTIPKASFEVKKDSAESVKLDPNVIKKYSLFSKETQGESTNKEEKKSNKMVQNTIKEKVKPSEKEQKKVSSQEKSSEIPTKKDVKKSEKPKVEKSSHQEKAPNKTQNTEKSTSKPQNTTKKVSTTQKEIQTQKVQKPIKKQVKRKYDEDEEDKYDSDFIDDSEDVGSRSVLSDMISHLFPTGRNLVSRNRIDEDDDIEEVNDIAQLDEEEERSLKLAKKEDKLEKQREEKRRKEREERLSKKKK